MDSSVSLVRPIVHESPTLKKHFWSRSPPNRMPFVEFKFVTLTTPALRIMAQCR